MIEKGFSCMILMVILMGCRANKESLSDDGMSKGVINNHIVEQLKKTKTVFFYAKGSLHLSDSFKRTVASGWDLSELTFDDISNFKLYASHPEYSYIIVEGGSYTMINSAGHSTTSVHYYLTLNLFKDTDKEGYIRTNTLGRIELFPDFNTMAMSMYSNGISYEEFYNKAKFYNWHPVILRAQLQAVSSNVKNNIRPWLFKKVKDENLKTLLSRDTLYVPRSLLIKFHSVSGNEHLKKRNVFKAYKYKYRICSDEELYQIFEVEKRGRFLFEYVKSSTDKFITVYDLKDKRIIYKKYKAVSYNLKSKNIRRIR